MRHMRDLKVCPYQHVLLNGRSPILLKGRRLSEQVKSECRSSELGQPVNPPEKTAKL